MGRCAVHWADRVGISGSCLDTSTRPSIQPKHGPPIGPMPARVLNISCLDRAWARLNSDGLRAPMGEGACADGTSCHA